MEHAEYVRGQLVGIAQRHPTYDFWESIHLEPEQEQTRVIFTIGFAPPKWWIRPVAVAIRPFKRWVLGSSIRKELVALRTTLESGA